MLEQSQVAKFFHLTGLVFFFFFFFVHVLCASLDIPLFSVRKYSLILVFLAFIQSQRDMIEERLSVCLGNRMVYCSSWENYSRCGNFLSLYYFFIRSTLTKKRSLKWYCIGDTTDILTDTPHPPKSPTIVLQFYTQS